MDGVWYKEVCIYVGFESVNETGGYRRDGDAVTNTNNEGKLSVTLYILIETHVFRVIMNKTVRKFM